jgi:hypothetical protein
VSVGVLVVVIFAVATIFNISSETTGRTVAHAELLEASAAVQQRVADQLSKIQPGLLIIESPKPTLARAEIPGGPRLFRLRHDRLVFLAMGEAADFQSFTDPTRGTPYDTALAPFSSGEALMYFGPGVPVSNTTPPVERPFDDNLIQLTASEWILAHRAILLALDPPNPPVPGWTPPDMGVFTNGGGMLKNPAGTLDPLYYQARMDVVVSSSEHLATGSTFIDLIRDKPVTDLLSATPVIAALWAPNLTPTATTLTDPSNLCYYTAGGFTLQPRLADFHIEWTDGACLDPLGPDNLPNTGDEDRSTRWFGLQPFLDSPLDNPDAIEFRPIRRQNAPSNTVPSAEEDERLAFQNQIEWSDPVSGTPAVNAAYRAIWRLDTWQYRPKALRFTYRIYDSRNRLKQTVDTDLDDDGVADWQEGATGTPRSVTRLGQEFSFVVPLP